jgi:flagellar M-ring protein FliF
MPPQILALLQNRRNLAIVAGILLALIGLSVFMIMQGNGGGPSGEEGKKLEKEQRELALVNSQGKAIEIQALLARQGIHLLQVGTGDKITLNFAESATHKDKDRALITLVQSGLMDKNVGLEAFDKGDLTASREEKRIKLIRSQQGELTRLIKKIDPIEDASVNLAIPEQTLFKNEEKPMSASVQVSIPVGTRLSRDKVKAITNLVVGSIQGLDVSHVAISDTNGTTYNSVLDPSAEMSDRLEEQDNYMKQKVSSQLDRLVGPGHYVVTVSTEVRQAPKEIMSQEYHPRGGVVSSKQSFNENLNARGGPGAGGPVSGFLPNSIANATASADGGGTGKDYLRNGVEVSYNNSRTQWTESRPVGMIEDISIAVTIDSQHMPTGINMHDLQELLAHAASPKVQPENVSIAHSDMQKSTPIQSASPASAPEVPQDYSWLYWAGGAVAFCIVMIILLSLQKGAKSMPEESYIQTQQELQQLREIAQQQQAQLQATQQQTQMLLENQKTQLQHAPPQSMPNSPRASQQSATEDEWDTSTVSSGNSLQQTLEELREAVNDDDLEDDNLDMQIKSWIEST